jgi:hypothetical protein
MPAMAATNPFNEACKAKGAGSSAACQQNGSDPLTGKDGIITKATALIGYLAGVSSIILIIVSAIMYVISNGDSSKIKSARDTLIYAVVGLVIVGVSQGLVLFILNRI